MRKRVTDARIALQHPAELFGPLHEPGFISGTVLHGVTGHDDQLTRLYNMARRVCVKAIKAYSNALNALHCA